MDNDLLLVQRAIFGDVKGAHNLIAASAGVIEPVLSDLASRYTDRLLPTEVPWEPYSCGFPLRGYYVVTRTFSVKATRSGMVETHAAMIPLNLVDHCPLGTLLQLLPNEPQSLSGRPLSAEGVSIASGVDTDLSMPNGYASIVRLLLEGRVPIWLGQQGFEDLVIFLWRNLWPEARRELRFRVSAEPNDLIDFPATLVCTPKALRANWAEQNFVDQNATELQNPSMCEAYLMAKPEGEQLAGLRVRLNFSPRSIPGLKRLERFARMLEADTADSIRAAVRLLNVMEPQPDQLQGEKETLLNRLVTKTVDGTEDDVLGLRNLDLAGFATAPKTIQGVIAAWMRLRIAQGFGGLRVATEIYLADHAWKQIASIALSEAFEPWASDNASLLWDWWVSEPPLVAPSQVLVPVRGEAESDLLSAVPPAVSKELRVPMLSLSKDRGWNLLHGAVLAAAPDLTTAEKLRYQLQAEADLASSDGLTFLIGKLEPAEMFTAALEVRDVRLLDFAGKAAAKTPILMASLNASLPAWRVVWLSYIETGRDVFDGITDPRAAAHAALDAMLAGETIPEQLLVPIAIDQRSDLVSYMRRADLWKALPSSVTQRALRMTAQAWLTQFLADPTFDPVALEDELQEAIITSWRSRPSVATPSGLVRLWSRFAAALSENDFLAWVATYNTSFTRLEATAIGRLVSQQKWTYAAADLVRRLRNGRSDLGVAVHEASPLLSLWDRTYVTVFTYQPAITMDEWWDAWSELSIRLYPRGVEDDNIWEDADGKLSRVRQGTGQEQWVHALNLLRNGGAGGSMTVEGLLHEMRKDFRGNSDLELLETIYLKRLHRQLG